MNTLEYSAPIDSTPEQPSGDEPPAPASSSDWNERARRRIERDRLEEWDRACERMSDEKLLDSIRQREASIDFHQRCLGPKELDRDAAYVAFNLKLIDHQEKALSIGRDVWIERKGLRAAGRDGLEALVVNLEESIGILEDRLRYPINPASRRAEFEAKLNRATAELRVLDHVALGLGGKDKREVYALITDLDGRQANPRAERQLRLVRSAYADALGLTRMSSRDLGAVEADLREQEKSIDHRFEAIQEELRASGSGGHPDIRLLRQRTKPLDIERRLVNEKLAAVRDTLTRRSAEPPRAAQ